MDEKHQNCDCFYCLMKCQECGSKNINIRYSPVFEIENDTRNLIRINTPCEWSIEMECQECGESFQDDGFSTQDDDNQTLNKLSVKIDEILGIDDDIEAPIDENGKISLNRFHTKLIVNNESD